MPLDSPSRAIAFLLDFAELRNVAGLLSLSAAFL